MPPQQEGKRADIVEKIKASNPEEAKHLFLQSKKRLLDVNHWSDISEGISASFVLTDQYGKQKRGIPEAGDHFRIDIPGPGSSAGRGYDWVRVEMVEDHSDPATDCEWTVIKVRPSEDPSQKEGVAHFFEEKATSSFIVKRENDSISAEVHGRNEKPNTEAEKLPDKIRNAVIGAGALAGFAKIQWEKLVKGLLNKDEH
ncbi:MAG TPA: hypothetical protein VJU78_00015 [Chitinophagaceae bacterium]|nr:hypothetical protein [Chitinophagaceae bacterium]